VTVKLSDWVFQFVAGLGVKHVFELTGGGAMHLNDSLGACKGLEYICTLHEQAAAMGAESYAKVANDIAVCLVTTGPGGTNALTGVAGAWLDSTPMLVATPQNTTLVIPRRRRTNTLRILREPMSIVWPSGRDFW